MLTAETLPPEVSPASLASPETQEEKYITPDEESTLTSWVSTITNRKSVWGLEKGEFYHKTYQMLGEDRISHRFGGFPSLVEYLHKTYQLSSVSYAYELKRAYEQYLKMSVLRLVPEGVPWTTDLLLELNKIKDEFLAEAVGYCVSFFEKNQSVIEVSALLTDLQSLQERYPEQLIFKRPPRESSKSKSRAGRTAADWRELEEIARRQRQCIDEQRSRLDALVQEQNQLTTSLDRLRREKQLLHQENLRLKAAQQALEDKLRQLEEEGLAPKIDNPILEPEESQTGWRSSGVDAALACKQAEGVILRVVEEWGDWVVYDASDGCCGAVEEGNEQGLLKVIYQVVPESITILLQQVRDRGYSVACIPDGDGLYGLQLPGTEKLESVESGIVVSALQCFLEGII